MKQKYEATTAKIIGYYEKRADMNEVISAFRQKIGCVIEKDSKKLTNPHLSRRTPETMRQIEATLYEAKDKLSAAKDFEELYEQVEKALKDIKWANDLTVCDTALAISAFLKILPQNYLCLHAGAAEGAKLLGLPKARKAHMDEARKILKEKCANNLHLTAYELEAHLCMNKKNPTITYQSI